jgi:hypothetical protein
MPLKGGDCPGPHEIRTPIGTGSVGDLYRPGDTTPGEPLLSLILSSRNDNYQGCAVWRLQTALNYLARHVEELKVESAVEVIVTDWGSSTPLRQVLALSPVAARVTRFLEVPPELAAVLQMDSPFPEVLANNAAIRRARGAYIGRIDQDTLIGREFFEYFRSVLAVPADGGPNESAVMFAGRRSIPIEVARRCPPLEKLVQYVDRFGRYLPHEGKGRKPWFDAPVGIFLMHRRLWWEARGYNEQLLYWGFMETELAQRLGARYAIVDLGLKGRCGFYHLSHSTLRFSITRRRKNARVVGDLREPQDEWGLAAYDLELRPAEPSDRYSQPPSGQKTEASGWSVELASWLREWLWQAGLVLSRLVYNALRREPEKKQAARRMPGGD